MLVRANYKQAKKSGITGAPWSCYVASVVASYLPEAQSKARMKCNEYASSERVLSTAGFTIKLIRN